ncbi:hypothetical protein BKA65DRAFT_582286 [Rhexocercosporidium sp. MPI-PUGE-AT-0058]|nr:hypothetical protein BKA65DRAFT_582286 [Rhexocercosporidium sp. MPI-PUGE-AT-0058]
MSDAEQLNLTTFPAHAPDTMEEPANFATLPTEILLLIISNLFGTGDVNAICRLTHRLYHLFLPDVFDRHLAWALASDRPKKQRECLVEIFLHAVKYNSSNLIQQLFCYGEIVDFKGTLPGTPFSQHGITYLHFAVTMDAPIIASQLMKHGSSSDFALDSLSTTYPDLTPLYLALARPNLLTQRELNSALRIACSYALPRTTSFLLARGADACTVSIYGISALHATLTRRARWKFFDDFYGYFEPAIPPEILWEELVLRTAKGLVDFSADPRLKIESTRAHSCDARCWKSINCDHSQQTPTHLAAASGMVSVLRFIVQRVGLGVLSETNGEGYTPFYAACVQGYEEAALYILRKQSHIPNLIVREVDHSTALHIACRFALKQVAAYILEKSAAANINREDARGRTPLHEVLSHQDFDREEEVTGTLHLLAKFGADPDHGFTSTKPDFGSNSTGMTRLQTPRQIAGKHAFVSVRDMFRFEEQNIYRDWCDEAKKESEALLLGASWGIEVEPEPQPEKADLGAKKGRRKTKMQREKAAIKERQENFPALGMLAGQIGKPTSGIKKQNQNDPQSLHQEVPKPRNLGSWEEKQAAWVVSSKAVPRSEVLPIVKGTGEQKPGNEGSGKGKGKGSKNKWKKMVI